MKFTQEEIKRIDKLLAEVDEEQEKNGNILYSFDEVARKILNRVERENNNLQNIHY